MGAAPGVAFGRPYNAGSGVGITISALIDTLTRITGINKPVESEERRKRPPCSEVRTLLADSGRISSQIGWRPEVPREEGLARTLPWWRERLADGRTRRTTEYIS
jgi:UDP-glucose 4-epimerase